MLSNNRFQRPASECFCGASAERGGAKEIHPLSPHVRRGRWAGSGGGGREDAGALAFRAPREELSLLISWGEKSLFPTGIKI